MKYQPIKARSKSFMQLGNELSSVVTSYPEIMKQAGILMNVALAGRDATYNRNDGISSSF